MTRNNRKVHFGIAGCGAISGVHAEVIKWLDDACLVAAFSRNDERRKKFGDQYGITTYRDYQAFLGHDPLDVVVLCTPNGTHLDYGVPAAGAGKHLIIEKPLEITTGRGKKLLDRCRQEGVRVTVIYQNRFIPAVRKLKQAIDDNRIGDLVMIRGSVKWFRDQDYYRKAPWRGTLSLDGGGALINQAIHTVDLLTWLSGPVISVQAFKATLTHESIEGEDNLVAAMQFRNGALGVFEASTSVTPAQNRIIELHGTNGTAILNGDQLIITDTENKTILKHKNGENATGSGGGSSPFSGFTGEPHLEQYREILRCISDGGTPMVSGEESLVSLAFVEAAYRSSETGAPVTPETIFYDQTM